MKEDVWLINGEFGVSREHKVLVDDGILMVKSLPFDARSETSKPRKMEWVVVCVLSSGSAICAINGEECALHAYDMLLALPGTVLWDGERSADLLMDCLCISRKMLEEALPFSMYNWDVMAFLATHPVFSLSEEEYALMTFPMSSPASCRRKEVCATRRGRTCSSGFSTCLLPLIPSPVP